MTRVVKWWKRVTFWYKLKMTIALFGAGGEVANLLFQMGPQYHTVVIGATIVGFFIAQFIEDKDNNGEADIFQKKVIEKKITLTEGKSVEETKTTTTTQINDGEVD